MIRGDPAQPGGRAPLPRRTWRGRSRFTQNQSHVRNSAPSAPLGLVLETPHRGPARLGPGRRASPGRGCGQGHGSPDCRAAGGRLPRLSHGCCAGQRGRRRQTRSTASRGDGKRPALSPDRCFSPGLRPPEATGLSVAGPGASLRTRLACRWGFALEARSVDTGRSLTTSFSATVSGMTDGQRLVMR